MKNLYFLSDLHIGSNSSHLLNRLDKFLGSLKGDEEVFFLGDVFEFFSPLNIISVRENRKFFDIIKKYSKKINMYLLEGNHEFFITRTGDEFMGIRMLTSPYNLKIGSLNLYISHGDEIAGGSLFNRFFRSFIKSRWFMKLIKILPHKLVWKISIFLSSLSRKKNSKPSEKLRKNMQKRAIRLLNKYDLVICAHSHCREIVTLNNKLYINVGSFRKADILKVSKDGIYFIDEEQNILCFKNSAGQSC